MATIKTFTIPCVASTAPVPLAVQRGDLLFTSGVMGKEADGSLPSDPGRQMELAFQHMITLAEMAGIFAQNHVNVTSLDQTQLDHPFTTYEIDLEVQDVPHLNRILSALRASDSIAQAERV